MAIDKDIIRGSSRRFGVRKFESALGFRMPHEGMFGMFCATDGTRIRVEVPRFGADVKEALSKGRMSGYDHFWARDICRISVLSGGDFDHLPDLVASFEGKGAVDDFLANVDPHMEFLDQTDYESSCAYEKLPGVCWACYDEAQKIAQTCDGTFDPEKYHAFMAVETRLWDAFAQLDIAGAYTFNDVVYDVRACRLDSGQFVSNYDLYEYMDDLTRFAEHEVSTRGYGVFNPDASAVSSFKAPHMLSASPLSPEEASRRHDLLAEYDEAHPEADLREASPFAEDGPVEHVQPRRGVFITHVEPAGEFGHGEPGSMFVGLSDCSGITSLIGLRTEVMTGENGERVDMILAGSLESAAVRSDVNDVRPAFSSPTYPVGELDELAWSYADMFYQIADSYSAPAAVSGAKIVSSDSGEYISYDVDLTADDGYILGCTVGHIPSNSSEDSLVPVTVHDEGRVYTGPFAVPLSRVRQSAWDTQRLIGDDKSLMDPNTAVRVFGEERTSSFSRMGEVIDAFNIEMYRCDGGGQHWFLDTEDGDVFLAMGDDSFTYYMKATIVDGVTMSDFEDKGVPRELVLADVARTFANIVNEPAFSARQKSNVKLLDDAVTYDTLLVTKAEHIRPVHVGPIAFDAGPDDTVCVMWDATDSYRAGSQEMKLSKLIGLSDSARDMMLSGEVIMDGPLPASAYRDAKWPPVGGRSADKTMSDLDPTMYDDTLDDDMDDMDDYDV